jgi:hypothetical protein
MAGIVRFNKPKYKISGNISQYMDLSFDREWSQIQLIKNFFEQFVIERMNNNSQVHKIGIAVSELLENAVRYSIKKKIRIIIQQIGQSYVFIIHVTNNSSKMNIRKLKERLKEMRAMDSLKYYIFRMRESVKDKLASPGLGLARIYHEAGAHISAKIDENKKLIGLRVIIDLN